ncbi:DGQHR domain-containing protein [Azospirillum fermentarium]|uniref:DGQHR domain-containing protein n=1 Tax=Azospirillum fermentarium TaxID=1233114 RepID=UPI0022274077|nr:DGQHR domain-containing protein [Azospirillum fermentarium]MCW2249245.1 DGQHR domain-containing protein [Azospirillum fermentarium]
MAEFPNGIVNGEAAKAVFVRRSKEHDEKTVTAAKKEALVIKVKGEEADGWEVAKWNKTSVRVRKRKPDDRQLEDDVWSLLYRLGFNELNEDRLLTFKGRQFDVFAKDEDTVFVVECTHAEEEGSKPVKGLIDKINANAQDVIHAIHSHYGKTPKLKIKFAIATRNVDWRKADKERAAKSNIAVITEQDLAYYGRLIDYVKGAARFQFLARYLEGEGVDGLRLEVPATRGKMGGTTFYNFLISPYDLMKIAYISHKSADLDTYQRMVKPARLKSIAAYIDEGGQFPTNIVINFKVKSPLQFEKHESFENSTFGTLKLPGLYGSAWVIDGQHRLYGFSFAEKGKNHVVPVLAYENMDAADEMELFIDINSKQVKVSRGLLNELYSNLNYGSEDPVKQFEALYPRVALRLGAMAKSPIRNRVLTVDKDKDHFRCLTLTSLADGIKENRFLGTVTHAPPNPHVYQLGQLSALSGDYEETAEKAADVLVAYFALFAKGVPANWDLGDAKGGFLCTNNGLRALMRLLKELIAYVEDSQQVKAIHLDADDLVERVAPLVQPIINFFRTADATQVKAFRDRQALDGVKKNYLSMMGIIHDAIPQFTSKDLTEYLKDRDEKGTQEADLIIKDINKILYNDVIARLKQKFGTENDAWWWQGVPQPIRKECFERANNDNGEKPLWQYLSLATYQSIAVHNWDIFQDSYALGEKVKKGDAVRWIAKLSKARQTTAHPEKGVLSKDEVAWVRSIYIKVKAHIVGEKALESA